MANIQELNTTAAFNQFVADIRAGKDIDFRQYLHYAKYFFDAKTEKELRAVMWTYLPLSEPNYDEVRELLENPYIDECWDLHGYRDDLLHKLDTQHIQLSTLEKNDVDYSIVHGEI